MSILSSLEVQILSSATHCPKIDLLEQTQIISPSRFVCQLEMLEPRVSWPLTLSFVKVIQGVTTIIHPQPLVQLVQTSSRTTLGGTTAARVALLTCLRKTDDIQESITRNLITGFYHGVGACIFSVKNKFSLAESQSLNIFLH